MPSKSKIKGSSYERDVSKFLSKLYEEPFVRVPNSGAYVGGSNTHRKQFLDENQAKSFKGDIIAPDTWVYFNAEAKSYNDFPFHQVLSGSCTTLDTWLEQLMTVAGPDDINILFMKFNRKGQFVAVQSKYTWVTDQFMYYTSKKHGDWLLLESEHFWNHNKTIFKSYATGINDTKSNIINLQTENIITNQ